MKKQFFLWALLMLSCTLPTLAYDFKVGGIYYNELGGDSVEVTYGSHSSYDGYNAKGEYSSSIIIPETIEYKNIIYRVTKIGHDAFHNSSSRSITIPRSIVAIGIGAFFSCTFLDEVNYTGDIASWCTIQFGSNPLHSGKDFYLNNVKVTDLILPNEITTVSDWFSGCTSIQRITIPNSVIKIGNNAFQKCSNLTAISIPSSVKTIGDHAFSGCSNLDSITIPSSVISIGNAVFSGCDELTTVNYTGDIASWCTIQFGDYDSDLVVHDSNPLHVGADFYLNNVKVTDLILPNEITTVSDWFRGCTSIQSITIPNSVTTIGTAAFSACLALASITIPNSVRTIDKSAFSSCSNLTSITIPSSVTTIGEYAFYNCSRLTSITIPTNVKTIGGSAFQSCSRLTSITIPSSVVTMGSSVFKGCSRLREIIWNAKKCGDFYSYTSPCSDICSKITSFTFGDSVEHIPAYLCSEMTNLTSVTIPSSVTSIGRCAFEDCSSLKKVNYTSDIASWCAIQFSSNPIHNGSDFYLNNVKVTDLIFPNGITTIYNWFEGCTSIQRVTIPNSVTTIGDYAFYNCSNLTLVSMSDSITTIGYKAFYNCSSLTSLSIPINVTIIDTDAFYGCTGITEIIWNAKHYTTCPFDNKIKHSITSFTFGDSVEYIPQQLCYEMAALESIKIPNSVTEMGKYAFEGCTKLRTLHIGSGLTALPAEAFAGCTGLINLTVRAEMPPYVEANTFKNVSKTLLVHVPCTSVGYYKAAYYWNEFTNYQESFLLDFLVKPADPEQGSTLIVQHPTCDNITGIFKAVPNKGYNFKEWSDGNTTNPRTEHIIEDVEYIAIFEKEVSGNIEDVKIDASDDKAVFTWPVVAEADLYSLIIWTDETQTEKFCTMTFNAMGQLTSIDFSRNKPSKATDETANGSLNFTVTGLAAGTTYAYTLSCYDSAGNLLDTHTGSFVTTGITAVENTNIGNVSSISKVFENGTIYILRNGEKYTIDGRRIM